MAQWHVRGSSVFWCWQLGTKTGQKIHI